MPVSRNRKFIVTNDENIFNCFSYVRVWQHVVCMGLDKNNIPDEYLCEVCKPRPIDRKRAKALQARRRNEIFNNSSSSDETDKKHRNSSGSNSTAKNNKKSGPQSALGKKILDRKAAFVKKAANKLKKPFSLLDKAKKQYRKRNSSKSENMTNNKKSIVSPKKSAIARRKSQTFNDSDLDSDTENLDDALEPMVDASQNIRSWIDQYEEAVTNHYSPELRARLSKAQLSGVGNDLRASVLGGPTRCNVSLKGNGVKILTASTSMAPNTPVIECKGRLMLSSQYKPTSNKSRHHVPPYVFFYHLGELIFFFFVKLLLST